MLDHSGRVGYRRERVVSIPCPICGTMFFHPDSWKVRSCGRPECAREARRRAGERELSSEEIRKGLWEE